MGSPPISGKVLRFGVFELDPETQQLRKAGVPVRLQPQPLKVLTLLVSRTGQVVTREELRRELWGDETFVDFEQGLNYCIRHIRTVLGDEAQTPRYIETLPRRGYRFIASVEGLENAPAINSPPEPDSRSQPFWRRAVLPISMLLVFLIAAIAYWLRVHSPARLSRRDTIVIADFANSSGDSAFDDILKQALAIHLEQSPFLNILSQQRVAATLKLMNRAGSALTPEVAREVCLRTNGKVMLTGTIALVGSHYLLQVRAINCETGDTVASTEEEAENRDKILYVLQKEGNELRQKLGESLASVSRYNQPLPEATTSSLEALKEYSSTIATSRPEALTSLQSAVQLDPNFALAWAALGARYNNFGQHMLAKASFAKAYELRDRVSQRERFYIEGHYYEGTGETDRANQTYLQWIQQYPEDFTPYGNLGYNYANLGFYDKAVSLTQDALRLSPDFATFNANLEGDYLALNRFDDARAVYEQALARGIDGVGLRAARYYLAFVQHDVDTMQKQVAWALGKPGGEDWLLSAESDTAAYGGQLTKAHALSRRAVESAKRGGAAETAAMWQINEALRWAEFAYPERAQRAVSDALALAPEPDVKVLAAVALARSGNFQQAQKLVTTLDQQSPRNMSLQVYWLPIIRASLILDRSPAKAIELLQVTSPYEMGSTELFQLGTMYPVYLRGLAYLKTGQPRQASAEFQNILDHPGVVVNFPLAALARVQLARAQALMHDNARARSTYADFFSLWKEADADVPLRKQAHAEYTRLQ